MKAFYKKVPSFSRNRKNSSFKVSTQWLSDQGSPYPTLIPELGCAGVRMVTGCCVCVSDGTGHWRREAAGAVWKRVETRPQSSIWPANAPFQVCELCSSDLNSDGHLEMLQLPAKPVVKSGKRTTIICNLPLHFRSIRASHLGNVEVLASLTWNCYLKPCHLGPVAWLSGWWHLPPSLMIWVPSIWPHQVVAVWP